MKKRRRASVVCIHDHKLLTVLLQDPVDQSVRHFLPGGAIEAGEQPWEAAAREAWEETGYRIEVQTSREILLKYPFVWAGEEIQSTTHFYLGRLAPPRQMPEAVSDASYNVGLEWLPLDQVEQKMGYHQEILGAVRRLIEAATAED